MKLISIKLIPVKKQCQKREETGAKEMIISVTFQGFKVQVGDVSKLESIRTPTGIYTFQIKAAKPNESAPS